MGRNRAVLAGVARRAGLDVRSASAGGKARKHVLELGIAQHQGWPFFAIGNHEPEAVDAGRGLRLVLARPLFNPGLSMSARPVYDKDSL